MKNTQQYSDYDRGTTGTSNTSLARRIGENFSWKALLLDLFAAFLFIGFFVFVFPQIPAGSEKLIAIAAFLGGIILTVATSLYDWYGKPRNWLVEIPMIIIGAVVFVSSFYISNVLVNFTLKSFAAGIAVSMLIWRAHRVH